MDKRPAIMTPWGYQEMPPKSAEKYRRPQEISVKAYSSPVIHTEDKKAEKPVKAKAEKKVPDREAWLRKFKQQALQKKVKRIAKLFANGPMTVNQIHEAEGGTGSSSNVNTRMNLWLRDGLVKVVGTVGKAPVLQKVWDKA